jgi:hypothetical protein
MAFAINRIQIPKRPELLPAGFTIRQKRGQANNH